MDRDSLIVVSIISILAILFGIIVILMSCSLDDALQEKRQLENFKNCIIYNQENILSCGYLENFNKLKGE